LTNKPSLNKLRDIFPVFQDVPDEQLAYLSEKSVLKTISQDEYLFHGQEPANYLLLILSGHLNISLEQKGELNNVGELEVGSITGVLPFSRMVKATASARATEDSLILAFPKSEFPFVIREFYKLTEVLVHEMNSRIRTFTTMQQQNDRMLSLGKLSAGLAHELNNPASAIARSSSELKKHLAYTPESFKGIMEIQLTPEMVDNVNAILSKKISAPAKALSMMERQDAEDDLSDFLEDFDLNNIEDILENLVEFHFDVEDLQKIINSAGEENFPSMLSWIESNLSTERMVSTIEDSSKRIAELVSSIKSFTHMDQGTDKSLEHLEQGLESTLTMLNHKVRSRKIMLDKQYQTDLPPVQIWAGQINQVFTNIIDNAIDALEGINKPQITLRTTKKGDYVRVYIADNGPGIPTEKQGFVFDAFFTTKGVGKGTGMGLEIARRIVERHKGSLNFQSKPGFTEFEICLPINN
jgi:signal transduction histidine kinase